MPWIANNSSFYLWIAKGSSFYLWIAKGSSFWSCSFSDPLYVSASSTFSEIKMAEIDFFAVQLERFELSSRQWVSPS